MCICICNISIPSPFSFLKVFIAVHLSLPYITGCTVFINNLINNNTSVLIVIFDSIIIAIVINVSEIAGPALQCWYAIGQLNKQLAKNASQSLCTLQPVIYMYHSDDQLTRTSSTNNLQKMQLSFYADKQATWLISIIHTTRNLSFTRPWT